MMRLFGSLAVAALVVASTAHAIAQRAVVGPSETSTTTATILRVDPATRFMTLRREDGSEFGVAIPQDFTRIGELHAGDTVTISYRESIVYRVVRRGSRPKPSEEVAATQSTTTPPIATLSYQRNERVTVTAVDRDKASITVSSPDGRIVSRRVEHASDLAGVKTGDRIDITYTEAVLATVERPKSPRESEQKR